MNYKLVLTLWAIFAASIIYWDIHRYDNREPLSVCHQAEVKVYKDRYLCTKCEKWCEVIK
jgi:hypothetical protein